MTLGLVLLASVAVGGRDSTPPAYVTADNPSATPASRHVPSGPPGSPARAVTEAYKDVLKRSPLDRPNLTYFSLYAIPEEDRPQFLQVFAFHVNSLSRERTLIQPTLITPDLLLVDTRYYGWDRKVLDRLAEVDPYFHQIVETFKTVEVSSTEHWPGGPYKGQEYPPGDYTVTKQVVQKVRTSQFASWVNPAEIALLATVTHSQVPIMRADWFLTQTAIQKGRKAGYYDFLGLKNRDDFFRLVGLDIKLAQGSFREVATALRRSGISIRNRQVFRFGAAGTGYWQTRDNLLNQVGENNSLNNLDGDYKHQAEEHYGVLPNYLFGYYLSTDKGVQQDTAPDEVGFDSTTTSNDGKIHVMLSCVRCHTEGLRPINDFSRRLFTPPASLSVVDFQQYLRLQQLYLREYERHRVKDIDEFAYALTTLNGPKWTVATNARAYRDEWKTWAEDDVTPAIAARELGVPVNHLIESIKRYSTSPPKGLGQLLPNSLAAFLHNPPLNLLREHWEESFSLAELIVQGQAVPVPIKETTK